MNVYCKDCRYFGAVMPSQGTLIELAGMLPYRCNHPKCVEESISDLRIKKCKLRGDKYIDKFHNYTQQF